SSSAWIRVSSSIPFSRSIVLTASMISLLISMPFVDEVAPDDRVVRNVHGLAASGDEAECSVFRGDDLTAELLPAGDVLRRAHGYAAPDHVAKVSGRPERSFDPRRRDVHGVAVEIAAQEVGD